MPGILCFIAVLWFSNVYAEEGKKDSLPVLVTAQVEAGQGQAFAGGKAEKAQEKKGRGTFFLESGVKIAGKDLEMKGLFFVTKNEVIAPGYFAFGPKLTLGGSEQFVGIFKWKANMEWDMFRAQKDNDNKWNFVSGVGLQSMVGVCSSEKKENDEVKFRLCVEAFTKLMGYIRDDFRVIAEGGAGIKTEVKISDHKINLGARYSIMTAAQGVYSDNVSSGQYGQISLGVDFDVSGKASRAVVSKK